MKIRNILLLLLPAVLILSCNDWTEVESATVNVENPWQSDPALWARYKSQLRDYKSRSHYLTYARFANSLPGAVNEKSYMRCLPDSLDIVSLTNAENFCIYDDEDMEWMRSIGTKVLYQVDLESCGEDASKMASLVESAKKVVDEHKLDGYSFISYSARTASAASQLISLKSEGQLLVCEGSPYFIDDVSSVDLWVLGSSTVENDYDLGALVEETRLKGIDRSKVILSTTLDGVFYDIENKEHLAYDSLSGEVLARRYAGLALYGIGDDYFHSDGNYLTTRHIIQLLNPSK